MKTLSLVVSFLAATLMVLTGAQISLAGDLKVSGFADIVTTIIDEGSDDDEFDSDGNLANSAETKTDIAAEVDFEYTEGSVTARLDLDIPSIGNEAAGLSPVGDIGIEQAKFVWMIPGADMVGLKLTGGAFNAPIGFEAQDAPDLYQTSNGQLFGLVPSNLAGFMVSGGMGPVALDIYFANEWRFNQAEENSVGGLLTITPIEMASLAVGYITSPDQVAGVSADENVLDIVLTGELSGLSVTQNITDIKVLGALEYLMDENNSAFAVVLNVTHETAHPHGLTLRYDSVDCDGSSGTNPGSFYCGVDGLELNPLTDHTPTSLTVAIFAAISDNLSALVEYRMDDLDDSTLVDDSLNTATLEFVATF